MEQERGVIEIHTSDRGLFKRCRRKYGWASTLRDNLVFIGPDKPNFWFGTGFHFALEDYHGWRHWDHPAEVFAAYTDAQKADDLPDEVDELLDLAVGMLDYYVTDWEKDHKDPMETLWVDKKPQVEVEVYISLNQILLEELYRQRKVRGDSEYLWKVEEIINTHDIEYVMTFDRVKISRNEIIYPGDYKTAVQFDELNLQTNPQAGSYDWGADLFYSEAGFKTGGMWWQQFKKTVPKPPRWVNEGKKNAGLSVAESTLNSTTWRLYREAIFKHYNNIIPDHLQWVLAHLAESQDERGDQFIRLETLRRNDTQREVQQSLIVREVLEMLDPDLELYPNPTKDCSWDCAFKSACLAKDDGSDFQYFLENEFTQWQGYKDDWRKKIILPNGQPLLAATTTP